MNGMRLVPAFSHASSPGKTEAGAGRSIAGFRRAGRQSRLCRMAGSSAIGGRHDNASLPGMRRPTMTLAQNMPSPPVAPREPKDVTVHGDRRVDDYFWLRDKDDPRTLPYLKAENAYADAWFAPHAALKEELYQEMLGRIQQDDDSVPYRKGAWWYSSRTVKGDQYPRYIRRRSVGADRAWDPAGPDETLLELNE